MGMVLKRYEVHIWEAREKRRPVKKHWTVPDDSQLFNYHCEVTIEARVATQPQSSNIIGLYPMRDAAQNVSRALVKHGRADMNDGGVRLCRLYAASLG
jgi:hypothetical protein